MVSIFISLVFFFFIRLVVFNYFRNLTWKNWPKTTHRSASSRAHLNNNWTKEIPIQFIGSNYVRETVRQIPIDQHNESLSFLWSQTFSAQFLAFFERALSIWLTSTMAIILIARLQCWMFYLFIFHQLELHFVRIDFLPLGLLVLALPEHTSCFFAPIYGRFTLLFHFV